MALGPIGPRQVYLGNPASDAYQPKKTDIIRLLNTYEDSISSLTLMLGASQGAVKATKAALDAVVGDFENGDVGVVFADTDSLNGVYTRTSGAWVKSRDLPAAGADAAAQAAEDAAALSEAARDVAVTARTNAQAAQTAAAGSASNAASAASIAAQERDDAAALVDVANLATPFDTYSAANAAVGGLADQTIVTVFVDETRDNARTLYRKEGGVLVFKTAIFAGRQKLNDERTYYVRTDGDDGNTGLANTSGGAFATIQRAWDVASQLDTNRQQIKIRVADGTYTQGLLALTPMVGNGLVTVEGNTTTPANCLVAVTDGTDCFKLDNFARAAIQGFKMEASGSADAAAINVGNGAIAYQGNNDFGDCDGMQIEVLTNGAVYNVDDYTVSGGGAGHWHTGGMGAKIFCFPITISLTGTPDFVSYFAGCRAANINFGLATFSGSATGRRYYVHVNGTIDGAGADEDALPGDSDGERFSGGQYLGNLGWKPIDERDLQWRGGEIPSDGRTNTLSLAGEFTAPLTIKQTLGGPSAGPFFPLFRDTNESGGPYNDTELGVFLWSSYNSALETIFYGQINVVANSVVDGNETATMRFGTYWNGTYSVRFNFQQGLWMTGATGGDKGPGTINATAVYDDNTLLTDLVLDMAIDGEFDAVRYAGHPVAGMVEPWWFDPEAYRAYWTEHRHLPSMPSWEKEEDKPGVGELVTRLTAEVELLAVHNGKLLDRIRALEERLDRLGG